MTENAGAVEALMRDHARTVYRYARLYLDPHDAEDVVAEVFAVAWRRGPGAVEDPRAWLLGVTRKVMANHLRSSRRRMALLDRLSRTPAPVLADNAATVDALDELRAAVAQLRPSDRQVIAMLSAGDLTTTELAGALGVSTAAAAARVSRARRRLRAIYPPSREGSSRG